MTMPRERVLPTTVTYLVMEAPPRELPAQPAAPALAVMQAENIPLHFYRYLYDRVGREWLWVERLALSDAALSKRVHAVGVEVFVLYANGSPAGYYELDRRDPESVRLVYFGLMPEWTGRRIGPWFLGQAIAAGFSQGARELRVNTCTFDHPAALPLYRRLGFEPVRSETRRLSIPVGMSLPGHIAARLPRD